MTLNRHFDIAIIGSGITGLSAANHLIRLGSRNICMFNDVNTPSSSSRNPGFFLAGLMDNITRISHRHGHQTAQEVWEWSALGYDRLLEYCKSKSIPVNCGNRVRWISSPEELKESHLAVKILSNLGFSAKLDSEKNQTFPDRIFGIQREGSKSSIIDSKILIESLKKCCSFVQSFPKAVSLQEKNGKIYIRDLSGEEYSSEAIILANHLSIAELIPTLSNTIVSYADQWHEFKVAKDLTEIGFSKGDFFSWHHSHYWGGCFDSNIVRLGGARFLRKLAGFEAVQATLLPVVEESIVSAWNSMFPEHPIIETLNSQAGLDCWPSDELPLVGPVFGEPRILIATGYMGLGLAMGFYAGQCLAELLSGLRPPLPRKLWPERIRQLPD